MSEALENEIIDEALTAAIESKSKGRSKKPTAPKPPTEPDENAEPAPIEVDVTGLAPIQTPVGFDPAVCPAGTFVREPWDRFLPGPGFMQDLTYSMKGTESNTGFSIWSAAWAVSTILARDAWLEWYPTELWPNIYVLLIAPPSICKKSVSATYAGKIVKKVSKYFDDRGDRLLAFKKQVGILKGSATKESLGIYLKNESQAFVIKKDGRTIIRNLQKPAQFSICADEFTTLVGLAQYNGPLVDKLTKLYDGDDDDDEATRARGKEKYENIYVNMLGATTPDGMRLSMPETAFGGGFMSRVVVVYSDVPHREFARPVKLPFVPDLPDLVERLAWIAENCSGEYVFSPEAEDYFETWYHGWKTNLMNGHMNDNNMVDLRFDTNLRKLSMIVRVQRYKKGNTIELEDVQAARKILEYTFAFAGRATEEVGSEQVRFLSVVRHLLQGVGRMNRTSLVRRMSAKKCSSPMVDEILWQLCQESLIRVEIQGQPQDRPSNRGIEEYVWLGSAEDLDPADKIDPVPGETPEGKGGVGP